MALSEDESLSLQEIARQLRCTIVRMIHHRQAGHPGGSLSAVEILTVLFFKIMRIDPRKPDWEERDRFLLSKGHASALLYAILARLGYFPEADLWEWGKVNSHLQAHPDRLKTPGVEMTSGLLGHGIPVGCGLSLAARQRGLDYHVYTLLGDCECQAGIVWEGANTAAKYHLSNLTAIVDCNGLQLDGRVQDIMPIEPLADRWSAFGWYVLDVDGHCIPELYQALENARRYTDGPTVLLARTIKGKGVSFMENNFTWHGQAPNEAQLAQALHELGEEG